MNTPTHLYRGDSDRFGKRLLKNTVHHGQLQTNLISGGNGRVIFERPLIDLVAQHVGIGWNESHFLSFTEDIEVAYCYGLGLNPAARKPSRDEIFEDVEDWDFILITLDSKNVILNQQGIGIYKGMYTPTLKKFMNHDFVSIYLINVADVLTSDRRRNEYKQSIENAVRDKEWLIFPDTPVVFENGAVEYSAILDGGCLSGTTKCRFNGFDS